MSKYVGEAYPKGVFSVYCASGKDAEESVSDFELVVVITATRHSPQNFWLVDFVDCYFMAYCTVSSSNYIYF